MIKNTKENRKDTFLLYFLYSKVIEILEAVKSGLVLYRDDELNYCYLSSVETVNKILNKKDFLELKKEAPDLYKNITGQIQDIDYSWDTYKNQLYNFLSKIQGNNIMMNITEKDSPENIEDLKKDLNIAIYIHNKAKNEKLEKLIKYIPKEKKRDESKTQAESFIRNTSKKEDNKKITKLDKDNKITSILIIEPRDLDNRYKFVVNHNYEQAKYIRNNSKSFSDLIKIIEGDVIKFNKNESDYFNCNANCPLYYKNKYQRTLILENSGGFFKINENIEIKIISEKTFKTRLNKAKANVVT